MCADTSRASAAEQSSTDGRDADGTDGRLIRAVLWYQRAREGRPSPCRFFPSCSEYSLEALRVHGSARGGWLTVRRLLRCRPFGPSGFDPVPEGRLSRMNENQHRLGGKSHV